MTFWTQKEVLSTVFLFFVLYPYPTTNQWTEVLHSVTGCLITGGELCNRWLIGLSRKTLLGFTSDTHVLFSRDLGCSPHSFDFCLFFRYLVPFSLQLLNDIFKVLIPALPHKWVFVSPPPAQCGDQSLYNCIWRCVGNCWKSYSLRAGALMRWGGPLVSVP